MFEKMRWYGEDASTGARILHAMAKGLSHRLRLLSAEMSAMEAV